MAAEALYETVIEAYRDQPGVTLSQMFGSPGMKIHGKVFAVLVQGRLVVKLPAKRIDALVAAGGAERFDPGMGRVMKQWVAIAPSDPDTWCHLAGESLAFVTPTR